MSERVTFTFGEPPTGPMFSLTTGEVTNAAGEVVARLAESEWGLDLQSGGFWIAPEAHARVQAAIGPAT